MVAVEQTEQPVKLPSLAAPHLVDAGHRPVHRFPLPATRERGRRRVSHRHDDSDHLACRLGGEIEEPLLSGLGAVGRDEEAVAPWTPGQAPVLLLEVARGWRRLSVTNSVGECRCGASG